MNAYEYMARIGFRRVLGHDAAQPADEDDRESVEQARLADHRLVRERLLEPKPEPLTGRDGAGWMTRITWPDRMPGLKTWAGNQTLAKLIRRAQKALKSAPAGDLFTTVVGIEGASGFDPDVAADPIDIGFSPAALKMLIAQKPGAELLAIVGLETMPLVSFGPRECGFAHDGRLWRFTVEARSGGYYHRWGRIQEDSPEESWEAAADASLLHR